MRSVIKPVLTGTLLLLVSHAVAGGERDALRRARAAADAGQFREAEELLRGCVESLDGPVIDDCAVALEILRRIRLDHSLTAGQVLKQLRRQIPDATATDVERWTQSGDLQHRVIDGEAHYFDRAVGNLFRRCPEAKSRCQPTVAPAGGFRLSEHIAQLVAEAESATEPFIYPVRHRVRYQLSVKDRHPRVRRGAKVRCWLPFPQEYRQQKDVRLIRTEPAGGMVAPNGHPQRTVYFEQTIDDPSKPPMFLAEFEFTTYAYVPKLDPADVKPYDKASSIYRGYTAQRPPHILFTPEVRAVAAGIVGDEMNPLVNARRVFRWVSENIPWCAEMEYSTIPNLSGKGLAARRGDCGVQGLVFVTLCRAAGIPARWQSGWQTQPGSRNMHDWSEIYVEPWGWLPADASYGVQPHDDPRVQEFLCGHMDPYRMIVNLDYGRELVPPKTSFRSEPNDFQRGEIEIDGHNLYFDEWRWSFDVEAIPLGGTMSRLQDAFDAVVPDALEDGEIPGAVILVGRKAGSGYETWQRAYGFLRVEPDRVPMPADALFDLASMTKPIATGTSLMILIQQGKVHLDDPVGKYLPEFNAGDKRPVTVRHLMTHTSGMPPYVGAAKQKVIKEKAGFPCPKETRTYVRNVRLQHEPGARLTYSCLNAILCAEIVEAVSGLPLDRFATQHTFAPLKLANTGFNPKPPDPGRTVITTRTDYGAGPGGFLCAQVHDPLAAMQAGVSGNAGLFSTAQDLSRFAQMLLNGGELDGARILKPETIYLMTRVQNPGVTNAKGVEDRRGLLWDLYVPDPGDAGAAGRFAYGHTGYTGTAIRIYPAQGIYVIALTNRVHPDDSGRVAGFRQQVWRTALAVLSATPTGR